MSRLLRTTLPTVQKNLTPLVIDWEQFLRKEQSYKEKYADNYNKRHRVVSMPCLTPGDRVYVRDQGRYGEVIEKLNEPRSYRVKVGGDNIIRRSRTSLIHTGLDNKNKLPPPTLPTVVKSVFIQPFFYYISQCVC